MKKRALRKNQLLERAKVQAWKYWQLLRKDVRSNAAVGFAILSGLFATLSFVDILVTEKSQIGYRGNPFYWVIVLPFALWAGKRAVFTP